MSRKTGRKAMTLRLDDDLADRLDAAAYTLTVSASFIVRAALDDWFRSRTDDVREKIDSAVRLRRDGDT